MLHNYVVTLLLCLLHCFHLDLVKHSLVDVSSGEKHRQVTFSYHGLRMSDANLISSRSSCINNSEIFI